MSDDMNARWNAAVKARADGGRRSRERRKAKEAAAYSLACAVSAFICDARRLGTVPVALLDVLTQELDAYNEAGASPAPVIGGEESER
jgi:hypothetical protein